MKMGGAKWGTLEVDPSEVNRPVSRWRCVYKPDGDFRQDALTGTWNCRPASGGEHA
jgi:hypothetical protein